MALSANAALLFFLVSLPVCIWVAFNDMKFMKIPNKAVLALGLIFVITAPFVLPLADIPWRLLALVVVLVIGFVLNMAGMLGAGDAKFAAVMAPFVPLADARLFLVLFAAVLVGAFVTHRMFRALPALRPVAGNWASWTHKDFPMGLALGGTLSTYLALGAIHGV